MRPGLLEDMDDPGLPEAISFRSRAPYDIARISPRSTRLAARTAATSGVLSTQPY